MEEGIFNTEIGRKILALTKASFRVADLIPDLIIREKIKIQVLSVYKLFFSAKGARLAEDDEAKRESACLRSQAFGREKNYIALLNEIDILDRLFYLARHLDLVKEEHAKALRNGFLVFKSHIILAANEKPRGEETDFTPAEIAFENTAKNDKNEKPFVAKAMEGKEKPISVKSEKLNNRQEKMMNQFQNNPKLKLSDLARHFSGVSDRTIRNDLYYLIESGKIERRGHGNGSYYKIS